MPAAAFEEIHRRHYAFVGCSVRRVGTPDAELYDAAGLLDDLLALLDEEPRARAEYRRAHAGELPWMG